jgi:dihydrofolate reductase
MKILMAVSSDGFLASGPDDNMRWTGVMDKAIFRLLTLSSGLPLLAGRKTAIMLPSLPGRVVIALSRSYLTLEKAEAAYPGSWLIGGPTVALEALQLGLVTTVVLCRTQATLYRGVPVDGIAARFTGSPSHTVKIGDVEVQISTRKTGGRG